jgi:gephyrin
MNINVPQLSNELNESKYQMMPMEEALALMISESTKQSCQKVCSMDISSPELLLGSVLAEDVVAKDDLPPFRASVMDGYAVSTSHTSTTFEIVASKSFAG